MRSGRLRHYCTIQTSTEAINTGGQPIKTWSSLVDNIPCNVMGVTGQESIRGTQVDATATHLVETRFRSDVTTKMRVIDHRSRTLEVVAIVDKSGRERHMILQCREQA